MHYQPTTHLAVATDEPSHGDRPPTQENESGGGHSHPHHDGRSGHGGHEADAAMDGSGAWVIKAGLFFSLAGYFMFLWISGAIHNYIAARFVWLTLVAAALFTVLGAASLGTAVRGARRGAPGAPEAHAWHNHPRLSASMVVLLATPLVLGLVIPSQPLGASAVGDGDLLPAAPSEGSAVASGDSTQWTVVDWLRLFHFTRQPDRLRGREADVIGFVYRRPGDPPGHFIVARFMMSCCSADSQAIGLPVAWERADTLPSDTWIRVQGPVRVAPYGKNTLPIIDARHVDPTIGQPPQPYLYP